MKELKGIQGSIGRSATTSWRWRRMRSTQRLLGTFGTVAGIDRAITSIWLEGLPKDYYQQSARASPR